MKKYFQTVSFLISFHFFFSAQVLAGDKCSCEEYSRQKAAAQTTTDIRKAQQSLSQSDNIFCKARAAEWEAGEWLNEQVYDTAEIFLKKAEQLYRQSGCSDSSLLGTYKLWAQLYYSQGNFAKAQEMSLKMLASAETAKNYYEQANCYTMIAQLLNQTQQANNGIVYSRKAVPLIARIQDPGKKIDILFKLSKRYLWHYQDTKTLSSLDSSEIFSRQQLMIAKMINKKISIALAYSNLQGIAWEKKDYATAILFLDSTFMFTEADDFEGLGTNYFDKADLYLELKKYEEANRMADSALHYRKETGNPAYIAEAYELLARIAKERGDYKTAFLNKELSDALNDSIRTADVTAKVTELEKKYTQAKNEKTIKELTQQRRIYILLAATGLFALLGLLFFIRQQTLKNKQKILETEQRLNRARMNPHFFFNALSSLQAFAMEGNDGKSIASNLSKFSHIMRETLESTYKEYVTIEQESDFLKEYLELQKIRFPKKFTYEINIDGSIEPDETLIPSMILQPFTENSIEHGFTGISYRGHIAVSFAKKENDLHISIIDNGKGLAINAKENLPAGQAGTEHISRASQIIKDRIYLLNIKLKTKAAFSIENNKGGKGVTVLIKLPLLYKQDVKS